MKSIVDLKKDLQFNREMNELMNILRQTAIAEFQALYNRRKLMTHETMYLETLESFFGINGIKGSKHPLMQNPVNQVLLIVVTSDMGFLGGLNTEIAETGLRQSGRRDQIHILAVGDKGIRYLEDAGKSFDYLLGVSNEIKFAEAEKVADYAYGFSVKHNIGKIIMAYAKFHSFARQEIDTQVLLPCGYLFETASSSVSSKDTADGVPAEAAVAPVKKIEPHTTSVTFEPFRDKVVDTLIKMWWALKIYDIFWQSKLSELAARAMHLDGSMQELKEMKAKVQLQFFRGKHEIADRNIRDIFGGRRVLMKKER